LQPVAIAGAAIESLMPGFPFRRSSSGADLWGGANFYQFDQSGAANNAALIATAAIPLIQETVGLFNALHLFPMPQFHRSIHRAPKGKEIMATTTKTKSLEFAYNEIAHLHIRRQQYSIGVFRSMKADSL